MRRWILPALALLAATLLAPPPAAHAEIPAPVVYVVGDSIAAGWVVGGPASFPQRIYDRMFGTDRSRARTVAVGGRCLIAPGCVAEGSVVEHFQAEVLDATPAPTVVVLEIGTNDLGRGLTDAQLQAGYRQVVAQAHARGVRVLVGTIPPREASQWPSYWFWGPQRERVNAWIRATYGADVVDFDAALRRSDGWMRPEVASGDGVHPNRYGHVDLGDTVPLSKLAPP